jgi:hypothetical protein
MTTEFAPYEGAPNHPTWAICVEINNDQDAQKKYRAYADQGEVYTHLAPLLKEAFAKNMNSGSIYASIVRSWLMNATRRVQWSLVYDKLDGTPSAISPDGFVMLAYQMMKQAPWQDITKNAEYRVNADQMLREWTDIQIDMWINNPSARRNKTPITEFATKSFEIYFAVVDWEYVNKKCRSEVEEEEPEEEDSWETGEVIKWLSGSDREDIYLATLNKTARQLKRFVLDGNAPQGLYDSFNAPPKSSFDDVDWDVVEKACEE